MFAPDLYSSDSEYQALASTLFTIVYASAPNAEISAMLKVVQNPATRATAFLPGPRSWVALSDALCSNLTTQWSWVVNSPEMLLVTFKSFLVYDVALNSSAFKDGMQLTTLNRRPGEPPSKLTLVKKDM